MSSKINRLKELGELLKSGVVTQEEFENLKKEILNPSELLMKGTTTQLIVDDDAINNDLDESYNLKEQNGFLTVSFAGQWFLIDAKTKLFINGEYHSTHSTKKGFSVNIPIESSTIKLKVVLAGVKSTVFEIEELNHNKNYKLELLYSRTWGKYSEKFNFFEND